jgi:predicted Rossmann fold flavoprotein
MIQSIKIAVVGGGAAGMMAAAHALSLGADVTLFEKNNRMGRKLAITGKGRCNVTNNCTPEDFFRNVPTNPRFLYSAYHSFTAQDTMAYFEELGVPLKTERGNRVFPVSDKAFDIVDALEKQVRGHIVRRRVTELVTEDGRVCGVRTGNTLHPCDAVIVCTGGLSYPRTGSDGDGLRFAEALGLEVVTPKPSLVPMESPDRFCAAMQGLSLKNTTLRVEREDGKIIYTDFGEMMFTHFGVTGPMILSASSMIPDLVPGKYRLLLDLKPALTEKELDHRILSDFSQNQNRDFANALGALLPAKMIPVVVARSGIAPTKKVNTVTKEERKALVTLLKAFSVRLSGFRPIDEAIITKGGVSVKELNPKTMACKTIPGLYFAGEVIDVDAYTGGFNLQIAFSTAVCAAEGACYSLS